MIALLSEFTKWSKEARWKLLDEGETGRFRCFSPKFVAERGEKLDISWLRDKSLQSVEDLSAPNAIAAAIMEKLQTAMTEMQALSALLEE